LSASPLPFFLTFPHLCSRPHRAALCLARAMEWPGVSWPARRGLRARDSVQGFPLRACLGISGMKGNEGYWGGEISIITQNFTKSPSILFHPLHSTNSQTSPKGNCPLCPRPVTLKAPQPPQVWSHVGRRAMDTNRSASCPLYPRNALTKTL
jgi:hypothetical protein